VGPELTLADLVRNRTMSPEMAATLATAAEERRSLLSVAIPRMAGKSTVTRAALPYAPPGTPMHQLSEADGPGLGIPAAPDGGYLLMSEISQAPMAAYLWGEPVRTVFRALAGGGFSLATALHAGGLEEAFAVITAENGVPDEHAAYLDLMLYIRSLGDWRSPSRRAVAAIYEIENVVRGKPQARLLHRWDEAHDRFELVEQPRRIGGAGDALECHTRHFQKVSRR
jgi:hypothetical protein